MTRPLDADELLGLGGHTAGDARWLSAFRVLVDSYNEEARLSVLGRRLVRDELVRLVSLRPHVDLLDSAATDAPDTVVITGLPRTGTTLLHNLLALNEEVRAPSFAEMYLPFPVEPVVRSTGGLTPATRYLALLDHINPAVRRIHPMNADGPDECITLQQCSFVSQKFWVMANVPSYWDWCRSEPRHSEYCELRQLMLHVLGPTEPWLLKAPAHLGFLGELLAEFPNVRVVRTHRAVDDAVASFASLVANARVASSDHVDTREIGRQVLKVLSDDDRRAAAIRQRWPERFIDVDYTDLVSDPSRTVDRVYRQLGWDNVARHERVSRWIKANPPAPHSYDLADFGLTQSEVARAF